MPGRAAVEQRVPRGTFSKLEDYVALLTAESAIQNLISAATLESVWERHILDSLQLLDLADGRGTWVDIGSGAGLPGLVVALASQRRVILIEPRRRRADFLRSSVDMLGMTERVEIIVGRSETADVAEPSVISARAVASLHHIFGIAAGFSSPATQWVLPKGRTAAQEVANAKQSWQGDFRLVPSLTEPGSAIVVAHNIRRRGQA